MSLDDLALSFQRLIDRFVRWLRLGNTPTPGHRRFLIVQIDGLPRSVLERALRQGLMPGLRRMVGGASAGPRYRDELHTLIVHPADIRVPSPLVHPIQLYDHFIRYRLEAREEAA